MIAGITIEIGMRASNVHYFNKKAHLNLPQLEMITAINERVKYLPCFLKEAHLMKNAMTASERADTRRK